MTTFVTMYHPALGNVRVQAPTEAEALYEAHGWVLDGGTAPPPADIYLTPALGDLRYVTLSSGGGTVSDAAMAAAYGSATGAKITADPLLRAAFVALGQLAASPDLMAVGTITRSATGAATGFSVVWPDGATGTYTGTESTTAPGAIDSYTVTHVLNGTTRTYTQPTLTRDGSGSVTARPAITVV